MSGRLAKAILAAAVTGVPIVGWAQAQNADVPVKEVMLFSSGVGYFEHDGSVHGDGTTELQFKTNQINDILKSLILQDMDGGKVSTVTYPSQDPIAKTLRSFQVDITANPPLAMLLNQLRGAKVATATSSGEAVEGTILGVETHSKEVGDRGQTVEEAYLNILGGGTIQSLAMSSLRSIKLEDAGLQDELNKALMALAGARDQDKKPVKISFTGNGDRRIRIGYVVETPIWKSSYRLLLSDAKEKGATTQPANTSANLQGWAIVENQTDNDWNNVELSLVSGRPISFVEDLYMPLYVPRPVVEPDLFASLRPQQYEAGLDQNGLSYGLAKLPGAANAAANGALADQLAEHQLTLRSAQQFAMQARSLPIDAGASVRSLASANSVGELFQFTVGNVSLARQQSAMIPIITDPIEVERVSIYNASVLPRNPLNGARVKNTTQKHLLAGPITVIDDGTYAGDAQIDNIPPGQERLLSYGVDLETLVDASNKNRQEQIQTGRIVNGVLIVTRKSVNTQSYVAENKSDRDKTMVIEHPRMSGWSLVDSPVPTETTASLYRFQESVSAHKKSKLEVTEQIVQDQQIAILPTDLDQLDFYRREGGIPKKVQDALAKAIGMRQALARTEQAISEGKQRLSGITDEQNRIRENLRTVNESSHYYTRLMTKLNDQETEIEKSQSDAENLQKKADAQRSELDEYLGGLTVE